MYRFPSTSAARSPASFEALERRSLMSAVDLTVADTGFAPLNQPTAVPGAHFVIQPTLLSDGQVPSTGTPFNIYLSPTPELTSGSVLIFSGASTLNSTNAGGWKAYAAGNLPNTVTPGTWYPIVVVDPDNTVAESDETNNTLVGPAATVQLPTDDLVPPTTSAPGIWSAGSAAVLYTSYPQDQRQYPIPLAFSLSLDNIAGNADDIPLGHSDHPTFSDWTPAGFTWNFQMYVAGYLGVPHTLSLPSNLTPGTYHLVTTVDPDNTIAEPDETNNVSVGPLITVRAPGQLDLTVAAPLFGTDGPAKPGSHISVITRAYSTAAPAPDPTISYILTLDSTYGNDDDVLLGSTTQPALTPDHVSGGFETSPLDFTIPATLAPGHYKLFAVVDPGKLIAEYDESNNISPAVELIVTANPTPPVTPPVQDPPPVVIPPTVPTPPANVPPPVFVRKSPGTSFKTPITLVNPSAKSTPATFRVTFYVSNNATVSANDKRLVVQTLSVTLRPGQAKTFQLAVVLPPKLAAGNYYVIPVVTAVRPTRVTVRTAPPTATISIVAPSKPASRAKSLYQRLIGS